MLEGSSGLQLCRSPETSQCRSWRRIAPRDCSKMGEKERQSCYFLDMTVLQRAWFSMLFRIMKANIKKYNEKIWKQWFWVVGIEDQEDSGEVIVIFVLILLFYLFLKLYPSMTSIQKKMNALRCLEIKIHKYQACFWHKYFPGTLRDVSVIGEWDQSMGLALQGVNSGPEFSLPACHVWT